MSNSIDWGFENPNAKKPEQTSGVEQKQQPRKELKFMKLAKGSTNKIRPLGKPVVFYKFIVQHKGKWNSAVCQDPNNCIIINKYNLTPQEKYAVNVIDRSDGQIKILEFTGSVYNKIKEVFQITKQDPGSSKEGGDFEIVSTVTMTKQGESVRYKTKFLEKTPLTDDERKKILSEGLYEIKRIFKVTPEDKIEEKLFPKEVEVPVVKASVIPAGTTESSDLNF
jgi:hypothetical protein